MKPIDDNRGRRNDNQRPDSAFDISSATHRNRRRDLHLRPQQSSLKALAENAEITEAFPNQSFTPYPAFNELRTKTFRRSIKKF